MADLSAERKCVLNAALIALTFTGMIAVDSYYITKPVNIVKPKNLGEIIMKVASETYMMALICKVSWAVGIIFTTLTCKYETMERIVAQCSYLTSIIVAMAFIFSLASTSLSGEGIDLRMLRLYVTYLSIELMFPAMMTVSLVI